MEDTFYRCVLDARELCPKPVEFAGVLLMDGIGVWVRGSSHAGFEETDPRRVDTLRENSDTLGLSRVFGRRRQTQLLNRMAQELFGVANGRRMRPSRELSKPLRQRSARPPRLSNLPLSDSGRS